MPSFTSDRPQMRGRLRNAQHDHPHVAQQVHQPEHAAIRMTWPPCPNSSRRTSSDSTATLRELLEQSDATTALIIDKGGFLITQQGDARQFDLTTIAALASGAYMANQTIANLVHETNFNSIYQQGEKFSMFVMSRGRTTACWWSSSKPASASAPSNTSPRRPPKRSPKQLKIAQERDPNLGLDPLRCSTSRIPARCSNASAPDPLPPPDEPHLPQPAVRSRPGRDSPYPPDFLSAGRLRGRQRPRWTVERARPA